MKVNTNKNTQKGDAGVAIVIGLGAVVILGIIILIAIHPLYGVWQQGLVGQAELKRAEFNRKIKVLESEATLSSAKNLADAEIERAKGVARANEIIGISLKGNEEYLHYLWIHNLAEMKQGDVIYVPTEANLPILEANRIKK